MKQASAVSEIRDICGLHLPARQVMPLVLEALHRLVPSCTSLFDSVDENGDILDYYSEAPYTAEAARVYFDEFYNKRECEVTPSYSEQVRRTRGVIPRAEPGRDFYRSDFYNLVWRPRGVGRSVDVVIRHHGAPVGVLTLYRGAHETAVHATSGR